MVISDILVAFNNAIYLAVIISAFPLFVGMVVGLSLSIIQAMTSVQEQTVIFVFRLCAVGLTLFFCGKWGTEQLLNYSREMWLWGVH